MPIAEPTTGITFRTKQYDTTQHYPKDTLVYPMKTQWGWRLSPHPQKKFGPIGRVMKEPNSEEPELQVMMIGDPVDQREYQRLRILDCIIRVPDRRMIIVPPEEVIMIKEYCADVFEPVVTEESRKRFNCEGWIYSVPVFTSKLVDDITVL
jgi:hypothetical protein